MNILNKLIREGNIHKRHLSIDLWRINIFANEIFVLIRCMLKMG